jgi:hypothetical protein
MYRLNIPGQWTRDRPLSCGGEGIPHNKRKKDMYLRVYYAEPRSCRHSFQRRNERDEEEEDM